MPVGGARAGLFGGGVAIPDTQLDHFWYSKSVDSISPWQDEEGSLDASALGDPQLVSDGINSYQSARYDATDDRHETGSAAPLGSGDEWTAVFVVEGVSSSGDYTLVQDGTLGSDGYLVGFNSGVWQIAHNGVGNVEGGSPSTDPQVGVATYDGSTAILDVNGTEVINSSIGAPNSPSGQVSIAGRADNSYLLDGDLGAAGHEAAFADATRRDELTNLLADEFDIAVST